MYEPRFYQKWYNNKSNSYRVCYRETDLLIKAKKCNKEFCYSTIKNLRINLDNYIKHNPEFLTTLNPLKIKDNDPGIIRLLKDNAKKTGVGPMAGIAGLFAEKAGKSLIERHNLDNVIVENGGDIFLLTDEECIVGIYAGDSVLSGKIGIKVSNLNIPLGICTSAGTVGPSISFGKANAVAVISKTTVLADMMATAMGNKIKSSSDIKNVIKFGKSVKGIDGIIIIKDDKIGIWGDVEIVKTDTKNVNNIL